jgi:hypothetical protein
MTTTAALITDPASIASYNRGMVTSIFTAPESCLSTLSYHSGYGMYFGDWVTAYYDSACYPSSTLSAGPNAWDLYYCQSRAYSETC